MVLRHSTPNSEETSTSIIGVQVSPLFGVSRRLGRRTGGRVQDGDGVGHQRGDVNHRHPELFLRQHFSLERLQARGQGRTLLPDLPRAD